MKGQSNKANWVKVKKMPAVIKCNVINVVGGD